MIFKNRVEFKGAVIGMLLGDGYLNKHNSESNSHLQMSHSIKQQDYALWKARLLEYLTNVTTREYAIFNKSVGKTYQTIQIVTRRHPFYTKLRDRMYHFNHKVIDEHCMKMLTPLGLALWYMDDGCCTKKSGWDNGNGYVVSLSTHSFSALEHLYLQWYFQKKWNIRWRIDKKTHRGPFILAMTKMVDRNRFFDIVEPYIHESMRYKIVRATPVRNTG